MLIILKGRDRRKKALRCFCSGFFGWGGGRRVCRPPPNNPDSLRLRPLGALSLSKELWGSCMWYVFHGEDEFSRSEAIRQLKQKMKVLLRSYLKR